MMICKKIGIVINNITPVMNKSSIYAWLQVNTYTQIHTQMHVATYHLDLDMRHYFSIPLVIFLSTGEWKLPSFASQKLMPLL